MPPINDRLTRTRRVASDLGVRHRGRLDHGATGAATRVCTRRPVGGRSCSPFNAEEVDGGCALIGKLYDGRGRADREAPPDGASRVGAGEGQRENCKIAAFHGVSVITVYPSGATDVTSEDDLTSRG